MKRFGQAILSMTALVGMTALFAVPAFAYNPIKGSGACDGADKPAICKELDGTTGKDAVNKTVQNVIDILFYAIGVIAVIMIIIGGIKYTTSNGDSSAITSAKNTILYAVVGLVVAILAYAIVNFVLNRLG